MFRTPTRIRRDYDRAFFSRRRSYARLYFIAFMLALIVIIPSVALWRYDALQLTALEAFGMSPTSTPFASERAQRGMELYVRGDIEGAALQLEQAARLQPNNPSYLYEYGRLLIELERRDEAGLLGERLIEMMPSDPRGYALKAGSLVWSDPASAIPYAISGSELGQPFAPLDSALAVAYNNIGRYAEALQRGDRAIRIDPTDANARRSYSYPLIYTGRYSEAIAQLEQAIVINPNITGPYFELASLYRRLNQEEMAVAIYNRILEIDPSNARAFLRLCETYASVGQFDEGQVFCQRALVIDPQYASAHRMLGQLQYSRRNYEGSIESFETCIAYGSTEIECYYIRGLAHYYLNQCDAAWTVLNEALGLTSEPQVLDNINIGLRLITSRCIGYIGQSLPTPVPPTPIPPTPIGGV